MSVKFDQGVSPAYLSDDLRTPSGQISQERLEELKERSRQALLEKLPILQEGFRLMQEGNRMIVESQQELLEAREKRQAVVKKLQEVAEERHQILIEMFYRIFHTTPLPIEQAKPLYETYLADRSVTVEETSEGKSYLKINSMRSIIRYLNDHPTVKTCDFRAFKTEVYDIGTLAEYLKTSTTKGIALKNGIPLESKEILSKAVAARSGGLVVKYFA